MHCRIVDKAVLHYHHAASLIEQFPVALLNSCMCCQVCFSYIGTGKTDFDPEPHLNQNEKKEEEKNEKTREKN